MLCLEMALMADAEGKPLKAVVQAKALLSNPKNLIILFTLLAFVGYAAFQTTILLGAVKKLPVDFEVSSTVFGQQLRF